MAEDEVKAEAPAAEAPAETKKKKEDDIYKEIKKVPKPDEAAMKEALGAEADKIEEKQKKLEEIKKELKRLEEGARPDANSEFGIAKKAYTDVRNESRRLQQEKRSIYDQISAADELKKQQQDLVQRLKSELQQIDVKKQASDVTTADIDAKIKALEMQQQTNSLSVKEDKIIMEQIKRLSSKKPIIKQYEDADQSLKGVREHHNNLYAQLKAKTAEQGAIKEEEEKYKGEMDKAKEKEDEKRADVPALYKQRDEIRKTISEHRDEQRRIREEYNDQRREFATYTRALREQKQAIWAANQAERKARDEKIRKELEEEEAKRDPWEEEKAICEQLIKYVEKYLPKEEEKKEAAAPVEVPQGMVVKGKGKADDDDEALLAAAKGKKGKRAAKGGGPSAAPPAKKSIKLSHSPEDFAIWAKLGFSAPTESSQCVGLHKELLDKREWLKTAPPKKKKKKEEAAPAPAPAAEKELSEEEKAEAAAAEEWKAKEAELEAQKKADLDKKAKAKEEEEAKAVAKMQELEAAGKKVSGGVHKFDASEVDVDGGAATADDFLDAFGFGGDDDDAAGDAAADGDAAVANGNGASDILSIEATSSSTVKVALSLPS